MAGLATVKGEAAGACPVPPDIDQKALLGAAQVSRPPA
jgi:hypothetical protein